MSVDKLNQISQSKEALRIESLYKGMLVYHVELICCESK